MNAGQTIQFAKNVLKAEAAAIGQMGKRIGRSFEQAVKMIESCKGRTILTGMGKPGFIARKISATLASTGTPSFYLHPAEAVHGDLGMVTRKDLVIAISQSGETEEMIRLLPILKKIGASLIAITSRPKSTLAKHADIVLDLGVTKEACPLNLAPSASTTASLALGDALALCVSKKKKFKSEDFAVFHPGGSLGRKLTQVRDIMRIGKANPVAKCGTPVRKVLLIITKARAGSCSIVDARGRLCGIFTDGDLRRQLKNGKGDFLSEPVERIATRNPTVIEADRLVEEAFDVLRSLKIDEVPVVDKSKRVVGLLDVQDLLKAGV